MLLWPELQRCIWLECSLHRMVAAPLVMATLLYFCLKGEQPIDNVSRIFYFLYCVIILLWGGHKAAEAVLEEVNERTWDFQRLSSLSPQQLTLGKLFGSPLYCWYAALLALLPYAWAEFQRLDYELALYNVLILLLSGLICHTLAFLSSLNSLAMHETMRGKMRVIGHHLPGLAVGYLLLRMTVDWPRESLQASESLILGWMHWYGIPIMFLHLILLLAALFVMWFVGGAYWHMRGLLRMRAGPEMWLGFSLFVIILVNGFLFNGPVDNDTLFVRTVVTLIIAGIMLWWKVINEKWNGVLYRRLFAYFRSKDWHKAWLELPRWVVSYGILVVSAILVFVSLPKDHSLYFGLIFGLILFFTRDLAILHFFKLHPHSRRATAATFFYLAVLYGLLPLLLGSLTERASIVGLFIPMPPNLQQPDFLLFMLSGIVQVAVAIILVRQRWRRYWSN